MVVIHGVIGGLFGRDAPKSKTIYADENRNNHGPFGKHDNSTIKVILRCKETSTIEISLLVKTKNKEWKKMSLDENVSGPMISSVF